jgi:hypothetical protein
MCSGDHVSFLAGISAVDNNSCPGSAEKETARPNGAADALVRILGALRVYFNVISLSSFGLTSDPQPIPSAPFTHAGLQVVISDVFGLPHHWDVPVLSSPMACEGVGENRSQRLLETFDHI